MNRGMRTGVGGQRTETREKRARVERRDSRLSERLAGTRAGTVQRSAPSSRRSLERARETGATDLCACAA